MTGWVTINREMMDHPLFKGDLARAGAWLWLITHAAWKPTRFNNRGQIITLQRGELCAGRDYLAGEWGWSASAVSRFLTRLQTEQMIEQQTGQGLRVVTICNYKKYQDENQGAGQQTGQQFEQQPDSNRTHIEQGNKLTKELYQDSIGVLTRKTRKKTKLKVIPFPEDWQPKQFGSATKSRKVVDGWPPGRIEHHLEAFEAHHRKAGSEWADWQAAWQTWVLNTEKFKERNEKNGGTAGTFGQSEPSQPIRNLWLQATIDAANGQPVRGGFDP